METASTPKQKRQTHAERASELASMGAVKCRLVDEHGLSIYISYSSRP